MSDLQLFGIPKFTGDDPRLVLTTLPAKVNDDWMKMLVVERLAACVTKLPGAVSTYRWKDEVITDYESLWLIKTTFAKAGELIAAIRSKHPYELPEIVIMQVTGIHSPYWQWLIRSTANS